MVEQLKRFLQEVRAEFYKISWPSRMETFGLTVLVITMLTLLTLILFFYDFAFGRAIGFLFELFGVVRPTG